MFIDCFKKTGLTNKRGETLQSIYEGRVSGKELTPQEQREIATAVALEFHKELHGDAETLRKAALGGKYKAIKYESPDKSAEIKAVKDKYEAKKATESQPIPLQKTEESQAIPLRKEEESKVGALPKKEKELPLNKTKEDDEINIQRLRTEEEQGRNRSGSLNAEATTIIQRVRAAIEKTFGNVNTKEAKRQFNEKTEQYLEEYAKETGQWYENASDTFGKRMASGQEQVVYHKDGDNFVVKLNDFSLHETVQEFLDRIALHATYFPSASYELIGFGKNADGKFVAVTKQPLIKGEVPTQQEIIDYMRGRGFKLQEEFEQEIGESDEAGKNFVSDDILVEDLHRGNVIKGENGEMFIIDPDIKLNTKEKGFGGKRVFSEEQSQAKVSQPKKGDTVTIVSKTDGKAIEYYRKEDGWYFKDSRGKEQKESPKGQDAVTEEWRNAQGVEVGKIKQAGKEAADFIRTLRPPANSAQSNILGLPIAIYDTAIVAIANAVEAGATIAQAVADAVKTIKEQFPNWNKEAELKAQVEQQESLYYWVLENVRMYPDVTADELLEEIEDTLPSRVDTAAKKDALRERIEKFLEGQKAAEESEEEAEIEDEEEIDIEDATESTLDSIASSVDGTGVIKKYMSGQSIEKHHGETPTNEQDYDAIELQKAAQQGRNIIDVAKKIYGEKYVTGLLDYINKKVVSQEVKALIYVSLENDLVTQKELNPERDAEISRLQNLVWTENQAFSRSNAIALGFMRLRNRLKYGAVEQETMEQMLSAEEAKDRAALSKAVQVKPSEVMNQQAENGGKKPKKNADAAKKVEQEKAKKKDSPKRDTRKKSSPKDWALVSRKKAMLNSLINRVVDNLNKLDC